MTRAAFVNPAKSDMPALPGVGGQDTDGGGRPRAEVLSYG